ncbi:hypothetical protein I4U23_005917 [Adineta vaga]|nr:hypothetical protein I4U23_005917 [Adineta vaga]
MRFTTIFIYVLVCLLVIGSTVEYVKADNQDTANTDGLTNTDLDGDVPKGLQEELENWLKEHQGFIQPDPN